MRFATPKRGGHAARSLSVRSSRVIGPAKARDLPYPTQTLLVLVLAALACRAEASPLFEDDKVLAISLTGPFSTLIEEKKSRAEFPFVLGVDGVEQRINVRVRGKSRTRVCDFPPLRLDFTGQRPEETVFVGQGKLKLVTHCRNSAAAQADMLEEYAAYKIFNLISDVSYKVRLVEVTYYDSDGRMKEKSFVRKGFLIESSSELADRVGGERVKTAGVSMNSLDEQQAADVFVFQYLIGNTDWSLVTAEADDTCCHNVDLLEIESRRFPVPYDFDLAGLVNAPYARPDPSIGTRKVTQRRYRGYCLSSGAVAEAINSISGREDDILGVLPQVPGLSEKNVKAGNKFLGGFFERAENADKLERSFERKCL